jgi:DNA-directed RNA polymerase sigma subunit (sigma70/sigma32)
MDHEDDEINARDSAVYAMRKLGKSLDEIADHFNLTPQRVGQIERAVKAKMVRRALYHGLQRK